MVRMARVVLKGFPSPYYATGNSPFQCLPGEPDRRFYVATQVGAGLDVTFDNSPLHRSETSSANCGVRPYNLMFGGRNSGFEQVLAQIAEELRSQYTLGYPDHPDDGQYQLH
jgi:hypothetical protein